MTQLTDEQVVKEKWPDAQLANCACGSFHICKGYPNKGFGLVLSHIGRGDSPEAAWHDAAERIRKERDAAQARVKELEAQIEWLTRPVTEKEFDEYFRPNYSTRDTATVPDVDKLLASRASAEKEQQ